MLMQPSRTLLYYGVHGTLRQRSRAITFEGEPVALKCTAGQLAEFASDTIGTAPSLINSSTISASGRHYANIQCWVAAPQLWKVRLLDIRYLLLGKRKKKRTVWIEKRQCWADVLVETGMEKNCTSNRF